MGEGQNLAGVGTKAVRLWKLRQTSIPGQNEMALVISSLGRPQADGAGKGLLSLALYSSQLFLLHLHEQAAPTPRSSGLLAAPPPRNP